MGASYEGLATGAGAASGLETLLARLRAEEQLRNQGRQIDVDQFNAESSDRARQGQLGVQQGELGEKSREFDASAPVREATASNLESEAGHNVAETGILNERLPILRGLRGIVEGQAGTQGRQVNGSGAGASGLGGLDNPAGRLRLTLAGVAPSGVWERPTADEEFLDSAAKSRGMADRNDPGYTFDMRTEDLAKKPQTVISQGNLDLSQQRLKLQTQEAADRKRMNSLRIQDLEKKLTALPEMNKELALAEFRNRIQHDVTTTRTWTQWFNGEDVPDPSSQIESIAADVMKKYGQPQSVAAPGQAGSGSSAAPVTAPPITGGGAGSDLDAILAARRKR